MQTHFLRLPAYLRNVCFLLLTMNQTQGSLPPGGSEPSLVLGDVTSEEALVIAAGPFAFPLTLCILAEAFYKENLIADGC